MKPIYNYILLVDYYRKPSRRRNTTGRYRVAAKTPDEAIKLLREKIKFGSIQVYYTCDPKNNNGEWLAYKQVRQEVPEYNEKQFEGFKCIEPRCAIDPLS